MVDDLVIFAEVGATDFREEILRQHRELLADAEDGVFDERLVSGLSDASRDFDDTWVVPLAGATDEAYSQVRQRFNLVAISTLVVWGALLLVQSDRWRKQTAGGRTGPPVPTTADRA